MTSESRESEDMTCFFCGHKASVRLEGHGNLCDITCKEGGCGGRYVVAINAVAGLKERLQGGYESRIHAGYREWVNRLNREGKILFIHISKLGYTEMEIPLD